MIELIMRHAFTSSDKLSSLEDSSTSTTGAPFEPLKIELLKVINIHLLLLFLLLLILF